MSQSAVFVGREQELSLMRLHLEKSLDGCGSTLFIVGEKGTGKTRLVYEFLSRSLIDNAEIIPLSGICNPGTMETEPFMPFRSIMEMLTGHFINQKKGTLESRLTMLLPENYTRANSIHQERLRKIGNVTKWILTEVAQELVSAWIPGLGLGKVYLIDWQEIKKANNQRIGEKRYLANIQPPLLAYQQNFQLSCLLMICTGQIHHQEACYTKLLSYQIVTAY